MGERERVREREREGGREGGGAVGILCTPGEGESHR